MIRTAYVLYALALSASWILLLGPQGILLSGLILVLWAIVFYSRSRPKALGILFGLAFFGTCLFELFTPVIGRGVPSRRMYCMNNLRNIGLALRAYHTDHGSFPPAYTVDENGKPLLSWRVLILPYLDSAALYRAFDLTKPWDSPENLKLAKHELSFYTCPSRRLQASQSKTTSYLAVTGPHAGWPSVGPMELDRLKDGETNTILAIEHHSDIVWTEPRDLSLEEAVDALASPNWVEFRGHRGESLFEEYYQGRNVLYGDARVMSAPPGLDRTLATELLTIDDGKPHDAWDLQNAGNGIATRKKWGNVVLFCICLILSLLPLPWVWIAPTGTKSHTVSDP